MKQKHNHENDDVSKRYCAEKMQICAHSLQPAMWANLTVCIQHVQYMEIEMGISRSKTHHLNIQMLTPNNIMHYGF